MTILPVLDPFRHVTDITKQNANFYENIFACRGRVYSVKWQRVDLV